MATTVKITITSDLTSDALAITKTFNLTSNGTTDLTETSGLARLNGLNGGITVVNSKGTLTNAEAYLFVHNTDTVFTNYVTITAVDGATTVNLGRVHGGDSVFIPVLGGATGTDIKLTAVDAVTTVEYQLFSRG